MVRNRKWWGVGLLALLAAMLVFALAPTQALAKTGWVKQSNGKYRYYSNDSSYFSDATYLINNKYYGFDKNGYRRKGWYEETMTWTDENGTKHTSSNWLYFGEKNDAASVGWKMIGGKWYWFEDGNTESGTPYIPYMASDGTRMIGKKNYLFNKSGALVTNGWYKSVWTYGSETYTNWYWADSNGVCPIGWKKIPGTWYYFWDWGGMASNTIIMDGSKYYGINKSGALASAGWFKTQDTYYDEKGELHSSTHWFYAGSGGVLKRGWQKSGGSWYYFETNKEYAPFMYAGGMYQINKKLYYFNKGGDMVTGWKKISGEYYYFDGSGAMVKNKWVGSYYLGSNGAMLTDTVTPDGYRVDAHGKWDGKPKVAA